MEKTFDCVEMQHEGGARVTERLAPMTMEQRVAYWRERTRELRERQATLRRQQVAERQKA
jgi:hypothetical protein